MLGGCEMLSRLHGTALKLLAYELLLRNYPTWRKRLTLVQVCFPYNHSPDESSEESREIREVVARIKAEFGDAAVHYWEVGAELAKGQWTVNDRLALFSISDVLLNAAMRDGLNVSRSSTSSRSRTSAPTASVCCPSSSAAPTC